jgi:hypothetical protein
MFTRRLVGGLGGIQRLACMNGGALETLPNDLGTYQASLEVELVSPQHPP